MDRSTSSVEPSGISIRASNTQLPYPPPLSQNMRPCSVMIGRISCPCEGYAAGKNKSICDACLHSFEKHFQSPAVPSPSQSSAVESAPEHANLVAVLFKHLLKSTPNGIAALQETSSGLRKKSGVSISDLERSGAGGTLIVVTGPSTCGNHSEGEQLPFLVRCLPHM